MTERVEPNDIVVMSEATRIPGGLAVVTEVRDWGVICYVQLGGPVPWATITVDDNRAWFRLAWENFRVTGGRVPS